MEDKDVKVYRGTSSLNASNKDNLVGKINMILMNLPEGVSDLAKVRYIYMKFGSMFCYDYGIVSNEDIAGVRVNYDNVDKFQTCTQIAEILATGLTSVNSNIETKVIPRTVNPNSRYSYEHMATVATFKDTVTGLEYSLLLDLTLDLYRIQAGMETRQFGFSTDAYSTYDIISLNECKEMDEELGLIDENGYFDNNIAKVKEELKKSNLNTYEKLKYAWTKLKKNFSGPHEARVYFENMIRECVQNFSFNVYSMYFENVSKTEFESLFIISSPDCEDIYLLVDNNFGVLKTDANAVKKMISQGWTTTSNSLEDVLGTDPYEEHNGIKK